MCVWCEGGWIKLYSHGEGGQEMEERIRAESVSGISQLRFWIWFVGSCFWICMSVCGLTLHPCFKASVSLMRLCCKRGSPGLLTCSALQAHTLPLTHTHANTMPHRLMPNAAALIGGFPWMEWARQWDTTFLKLHFCLSSSFSHFSFFHQLVLLLPRLPLGDLMFMYVPLQRGSVKGPSCISLLSVEGLDRTMIDEKHGGASYQNKPVKYK